MKKLLARKEDEFLSTANHRGADTTMTIHDEVTTAQRLSSSEAGCEATAPTSPSSEDSAIMTGRPIGSPPTRARQLEALRAARVLIEAHAIVHTADGLPSQL